MRACRIALITVFVLLGFAGHAVGANLKLLLLHSKTGLPVRGKKLCISFRQNPNVQDTPEICGRTDSQGTMIVALPDESLEQWAYVGSSTNDFVPCFRQPFATMDLARTGVIAPNTCGPERNDFTPNPGMLVLYGHQMSFWEVLKSMKGELP
jgi:hypothetical protein